MRPIPHSTQKTHARSSHKDAHHLTRPAHLRRNDHRPPVLMKFLRSLSKSDFLFRTASTSAEFIPDVLARDVEHQ